MNNVFKKFNITHLVFSGNTQSKSLGTLNCTLSILAFNYQRNPRCMCTIHLTRGTLSVLMTSYFLFAVLH